MTEIEAFRALYRGPSARYDDDGRLLSYQKRAGGPWFKRTDGDQVMLAVTAKMSEATPYAEARRSEIEAIPRHVREEAMREQIEAICAQLSVPMTSTFNSLHQKVQQIKARHPKPA